MREPQPAVEDEFIEDVLEPDELDTTGAEPDTGVEPTAPGEPEPETPPEGEPPPEPVEPTEGPVYNEALGRWQDPITKRFVAAPEGAKPPTAAPEGAPAAEPAVTAQDQPPAEPPTETGYAPFQYRAAGQTFSLEGSELGEDGLFVPSARLPELALKLGRGEISDHRLAEFQRRSQAQLNEARQQAEVADRVLERLMELSQNPEAMADWLDKVSQNYPLLKAQAEIDALRAVRDGEQEEVQQWQQEREIEELIPTCSTTLEGALRQLATEAPYKGLDQAFYADLWDRLTEAPMFEQLFIQAKEEELGALPGAQVVARLQDGTVVAFNAARLRQELDYAARLTGQTAKAVSEAQQANVQATATSPAPPAVPAGGGAAPTAAEEHPTFESREEMERWYEQRMGGSRP